MKKIYQKNSSNVNGDCMQASLASLFNLELDEVPKFIELGDRWWSAINDFVKEQGYQFQGYLYGGKDVLEKFHITNVSKLNGVDGFFYAVVNSPKYHKEGGTHAVIVDKNLCVVHDPCPAYENIVYPQAEELGYNGILEVSIFEKINK